MKILSLSWSLINVVFHFESSILPGEVGGSVANPDNDLGYYTVHLELWFSKADRCWGKTCLAWKLSGGRPAVAAEERAFSGRASCSFTFRIWHAESPLSKGSSHDVVMAPASCFGDHITSNHTALCRCLQSASPVTPCFFNKTALLITQLPSTPEEKHLCLHHRVIFLCSLPRAVWKRGIFNSPFNDTYFLNNSLNSSLPAPPK